MLLGLFYLKCCKPEPAAPTATTPHQCGGDRNGRGERHGTPGGLERLPPHALSFPLEGAGRGSYRQHAKKNPSDDEVDPEKD